MEKFNKKWFGRVGALKRDFSKPGISRFWVLSYFMLNIYWKQFQTFMQRNIGVPIDNLDLQAVTLTKYTTAAKNAEPGSTTYVWSQWFKRRNKNLPNACQIAD